jgi:PAS domain S-box-containing protein
MTESNKIEAKLPDNFLNDVLNLIADPIFVKDANFKFVFANLALYDMLGLRKEDVIGKTLGESLPKDQMDTFLKNDRIVLETGNENVSEEPLTGKSGEILTVVTKKTRYIDGQGNKFLIAVLRDITKDKKNINLLIESEEKLKTIIDNSTDNIFMLDKEYKYIMVNSVVARNFGLTTKDIIGKSVLDMFPEQGASELIRNVKTVFDTGKNLNTDEKIIIHGNETYHNSSLSAVKNEHEEVIAVVGSVRDITDRKIKEDALLEKVDELEKINRMMVSRELKMVELKKQLEKKQ